MKTFVKCEICNAETPADRCIFAIHKRVIEGKEYTYCCSIMQRKHDFNRLAIDPKGSEKERSKSSRNAGNSK